MLSTYESDSCEAGLPASLALEPVGWSKAPVESEA